MSLLSKNRAGLTVKWEFGNLLNFKEKKICVLDSDSVIGKGKLSGGQNESQPKVQIKVGRHRKV